MSQPVIDFASYITERSQNFTGRQWVFDGVDAWLTNPKASRYLFITGEPGIGKTAIAARLTQIRDLAANHFCIARQAETIDPLNFARFLSFQLTRLDGFVQCLLEEKGVHIDVNINVQENYGQIIGVQIDNLLVEAPSATLAFNRTVLDPLKRLYTDGFDQQLVILVDALDEAMQQRGPETIVHLLANTDDLPLQVRFVLTTRPESSVLRHFENLEIPYLPLDAGGEENRHDVQIFIRGQLVTSEALHTRLSNQNVSTQQFIEHLTEKSEGNFLYLTWLLPAIARGEQQVDTWETLPQGLNSIYREFLRTRTVGEDLRGRWRSWYRPVLGVLAAAQEPLTGEQLTHFTGLSEQDLHDIVLDVQQFLDPARCEHGFYQLYHQSLTDFFKDKDRAGEFWIDLVPAHQQIVRYYQEFYAPRWSECDSYALSYLPVHLKEGDQGKDLHALLSDLNWLKAKLDLQNSVSLLADFTLLSADSELHRIERVIRQTAHVLAQDPTQLLSQLLARLPQTETFNPLFEQARQDTSASWLQPLIPSLLTAPTKLHREFAGHEKRITAIGLLPQKGWMISASDDAMLSVWDMESSEQVHSLTGHQHKVKAVAVSPDEHYAVSASYDQSLIIWDVEEGQLLGRLEGHETLIQSVIFDDTGQHLISVDVDRTILLWDFVNRKILEKVNLSDVAHCNRLSSQKVAEATVTDEDKALLEDEHPIDGLWQWLESRNINVSQGFAKADDAEVVALSPGGKFGIWGTRHQLSLWNVQQHTALHSWHQADVSTAVFHPDNRYLFYGTVFGSLVLWDIAGNREIDRWQAHQNNITALAITDDGHYAITGDGAGNLRMWNVEFNESQAIISPPEWSADRVTLVGLDSEGQHAITYSDDGQTIRAWDLHEPITTHEMLIPPEDTTVIAVIPDRRRVVSQRKDTFVVWEIDSGTEVTSIPKPETVITAEFSTDGRYAVLVSQGEAPSVVSRLKQRLASAKASHPLYLTVWDLERQRRLRRITITDIDPGCTINTLYITPDTSYGALLATNYESISKQKAGVLSGEIRTYNLKDGTLINKQPWERWSEDIKIPEIAITSDGQHVITAENGIAIAANSNYLVRAQGNRLELCRFTSEKAEQVMASFYGTESFTKCTLSADGKTIVALDTESNVHFLKCVCGE